jgi:predicted O-methyltransferase YrrM
MARANEYLPENINDYMNSVSVREPAILSRLREETASHPMGGMQIPPEHGQFLALLMQLMRRGLVRHFELARPTLQDIFVRIARPEEENGHA